MTRPIIVPYDPRWPARFDRLDKVVRVVIDGDFLGIDHVGSTSVPGLASKDVIDIQVTVASLDVTDGWTDEIGPFRRRAEIREDHVPPGYPTEPARCKRYWSARNPAAHMHIREHGHPNQRYALLFRDYLLSAPAAASAYEEAKRRLAALCDDTAMYADAKDPICDLVMQGAEAWAAATGWSLQADCDERSGRRWLGDDL